MIIANRLFAGIMIVIAAGFFIVAGGFPRGAENWPRFFAVVLTVLSLGLIIETVIKPDREADALNPLSVIRRNIRVLTFILGMAVAYLGLLELIGFVVMTPLFIGAMIWGLGYRNPKTIALVALQTTLLIWISFELLLQVPLPEGFLDDLFKTLRGGIL